MAVGRINGIDLNGLDSNMIVEPYSENVAYSKGDYTSYLNNIWKANEDMEAGAWDSDKWTTTNLSKELLQLEENVPVTEDVSEHPDIDTPEVNVDVLGGKYHASDIDQIVEDVSNVNSNLTENYYTKTEVDTKVDNASFTKLAKVTSAQTLTLDVTDKNQFIMGRANANNRLNTTIMFDRTMLSECDAEIGESGVVVADATLSGNTLTIVLSTLASGYFYVFGK